MVTRVLSAPDAAGLGELLVGGLPQEIQPDSLFAEGGEGVQIRAVRFRTRAVGEAPHAEVRRLDEQMQEVSDKITHNKKMQEFAAQRLAYLDRLENFTAVSATTELSKGVLNPDALQKLTLFSFEERKKAHEEALTLATEARELNEQLSLLQRKRAEISRGSTRTVREALVFIDKANRGQAQLRLSYLVANAGWEPSYNFRAESNGNGADIEYNAVIHQMSGEDWDGVALKLSTASPALSAAVPGLAPFPVALSQPPGKTQAVPLADQYRSGQRRLRQAQISQSGAARWESNIKFNWDMNVAANEFQYLELGERAEELLKIQQAEPASAEYSVSYPLPNAVSLASRSDRQMVRIAAMRLDSKLYYVATPLLTSYAYREAELANARMEALLSGPVSAYLDGRFMGKGTVATAARGQTLTVGFGADSQLRLQRALVKKRDVVQGGNREVNFRYRLTIENYKDKPVQVRLLDRIPIADRETDVRVTLGEMTHELSTDKLHERLERPKGILRWDVTVPASASGEQAFVLEYEYKTEFDRNYALSAPGGRIREQQQEFEALQKARLQSH
jgi:uncharacterized protein (TIGR02231 family)